MLELAAEGAEISCTSCDAEYYPPMADFEQLSFVIPGYTPETIPLARLIEYLQQMTAVLGDPENLHLIGIEEGSVEPVLRAPKAVALKARDKVSRVQRGDGTRKQVDAYNKIRRMVRRDARDAGRPALLRSNQQVLLEIPAAPEDAGVLSGVRQASSVDGQLIRVGGAGEDAALQVQDMQGRILSGFTAKRIVAKELAALLWEPVRLSGVGLWERTEEGEWRLERMQVQSYERLEDEDLSSVLERLRSLKVNWPEDALDQLLKQREAEA
jgi:hypothetical protein